jgi:serine/threonine protein phosphatase PrpC
MEKPDESCRVEGLEDEWVVCGAASIPGCRTEQQDRFTVSPPLASSSSSSSSSQRAGFKNLFQTSQGKGPQRMIGVFDGHLSSDVVHHLCTALPAAFAAKPSPFHHLSMTPLSSSTTSSSSSSIGSGLALMEESIQRVCLQLDHTIVWPTSKESQKRCVVTNGESFEIHAPPPPQEIYEGGSTANFCLLHPNPKDNRIALANIGDSRSLLIRTLPPSTDLKSVDDQHNKWVWRQPLADHCPKVAAEHARIVAAGAEVEGNEINGTLSTSRSFGDKPFKRYNIWRKQQGSTRPGELDPAAHFLLNPIQQPVIALPDIALEHLGNDELVLLVTDGITSKLSNDQITKFLHIQSLRLLTQPHKPTTTSTSTTSTEKDKWKVVVSELGSRHLAELARRLCLAAISAGSTDNCSAVIFRRPHQPTAVMQPTIVATPDVRLPHWSGYIGGPYYDMVPSFHDAFVATARLYIEGTPNQIESTIKQLITQGKHIAAKRTDAVAKRTDAAAKHTDAAAKHTDAVATNDEKTKTINSNIKRTAPDDHATHSKKLCIRTSPLVKAFVVPSVSDNLFVVT